MSEIIQKLLEQLSSIAVDEHGDNFDHFTDFQIDSLIAKFEAIINFDPDNKYRYSREIEYGFTHQAFSFLAELYMEKKEYEKARKAILKAVDLTEKIKNNELYETFQSDNYYVLGMIYYLLGQTDKAMPCFERSVELSNNHKAFLGMCLCYRKKRDLREARANLKMAKTLKALLYTRYKIL